MNYTALAKTALKLVKANGKPVTLVRQGTATGWTKSYDPVAGMDKWTNYTTSAVVYVNPASTPTTTIGSAVETDFDLKSEALQLSLKPSKRLLCVGIPAPVVDSDYLIVDAVQYIVVESKPLSPGATVILYDVWVK